MASLPKHMLLQKAAAMPFDVQGKGGYAGHVRCSSDSMQGACHATGATGPTGPDEVSTRHYGFT